MMQAKSGKFSNIVSCQTNIKFFYLKYNPMPNEHKFILYNLSPSNRGVFLFCLDPLGGGDFRPGGIEIVSHTLRD